MKVKVFLLKKLLNPGSKNTDDWMPSQKCTQWEILGHFDELYIYSLDVSNDFANQIYKDKERISLQNSVSAYYHPLYLLFDAEQIEIPSDSWYCAIVRIHFAGSTQLPQQFTHLSNQIKSDLSAVGLCANVLYGSEFSDMVLEVYGSDLSTLVSSVLHLRQAKYVGAMYTYFGVNYQKLISEEAPEKEEKNLDFLSIRFPMADEDTVNSQLNCLSNILGNEPVYCVTGVDDILVRYQDLSTAKLVQLFREVFLDGNRKTQKRLSSTIRLGISVSPPIHGQCVDSTLQGVCKILADLRNRIQAYDTKSIYSWWRHASELSKTIERMSAMPVMDEVIYLLAPGIRTFFENILIELEAQRTLLLQSDHDLHHRFVELCFYLMEQLMRLEGQLSQQPELRPVIYDIPVFLLEYILSFLNQVCETLQKADTPPHIVFDFLLVPHACPRIEALELFPATADGKHGLVQVEIPTNLMYCPREVLQILCHEVSHYVGQTCRLRNDRKGFYCTAAAAIFSSLVFNMKEPGFIQFTKQRFLNAIDSYPLPTIRQMEAKILECVDVFLLDDPFDLFIFDYLTQTDCPQFVGKLDDNAIDYGRFLFAQRLQDINSLFHEVYADICMLHLLRIPTDEYISSLLQVLENDPPDENTISYETFAVRIYTCLCAMNREINYSKSEHLKQWIQIQSIISEIDQEILTQTDGVSAKSYPIAAIYALRSYAQKCGESIRTSLPKSDTQSIYDMYSLLTNEDASFHSILSAISKCREKIINRI